VFSQGPALESNVMEQGPKMYPQCFSTETDSRPPDACGVPLTLASRKVMRGYAASAHCKKSGAALKSHRHVSKAVKLWQ